MKSTWKRFLSLVLCMCMVLALLPNVTMTAFAATSGTVTGLADGNIGLSFSGDADDAWSATGTTITGSVVSVGGTCSDTDYNSTLTIKNNKATEATLSFAYAIEQNSGTIQVDDTAATANDSFSNVIGKEEQWHEQKTEDYNRVSLPLIPSAAGGWAHTSGFLKRI